MTERVKITLIVCVTMLAIAFFIWPTPYTYHKVGEASLIRTTRLTGHTRLVSPEHLQHPLENQD